MRNRSGIILGMISLVMVFFVLAIISGTGSGKIITVDDDGEGDYTRIEYAVEDAEHGDEIRVWDGFYDVYDTVEIDKRVTIIGNGNPAPQMIAILMLVYLTFSLLTSVVMNIVNRRLQLASQR